VKYSAEQMAYDPSPEELKEHFIAVPGRGWAAYERFVKWKRQVARLDPDIRKAFPDDESVNTALRKVIELLEAVPVERKKRKTA